MASKLRLTNAPKPTVLRDFFASLDDKTQGLLLLLLLLTLNLEADSELYAQLP